MIDPARFVYAIRQTESHGDPNALGDDGRAFTSIQCHPPWLWQWASALNLPPRLGETWDEFACRVLAAFAARHAGWPSAELAMYYHKGHPIGVGGYGWDSSYANRFVAYWNQYPENQTDGPA